MYSSVVVALAVHSGPRRPEGLAKAPYLLAVGGEVQVMAHVVPNVVLQGVVLVDHGAVAGGGCGRKL